MNLRSLLLGQLTLEAIPYHNPIIMGAVSFMVIIMLAVFGLITIYKKWHYIMFEWVSAVDHKRIGIMYLILSLVMLLRGLSDAVLMRSQQAISFGDSYGYLPAEHFAEIFSAHGTIMIFFVAMPLMFGLINLALPLQIGARDVAYPFLNNFSFWMTFAGAMLVNVSLAIGKFSEAGWLAYAPLSGLEYSPGVGIDYYIWGVQIGGVGSLLSGINFLVTIFKMRCPGMTLMKMPVFVWSVLCSMLLVAAAFPILTVTLGLLALDRYLDMHFFTQYAGGNVMLYINLIWAWGHPEVYILVLPAFGIFSEIVATFSRKTLFGYKSMVYALIAITFLSFVVWLHHFFTMGAGANVNAFFGITTMIIAIPTGVKIFNWLFTMYKGKIHLQTPIFWVLAFITTFAIGGMTGVMLAIPPVDFQMHNSLFLVAHFHNVIIGGVIFGYFAGYQYWWPKIFGFTLDEKLGRYSIAFWVIGFYVAFMPLYALGLKGVMRRNFHFADVSLQPYFVIAAIGLVLVLIGLALQIYQIFYSIHKRDALHDHDGDPWNGRTLEWSTYSPPPYYNYATIPSVNDLDPFWHVKEHSDGIKFQDPNTIEYHDIHMPKNTFAGFIMGLSAGFCGFALVWHAWLTAGLLFLVFIVTFIHKTFNLEIDFYVKADEVKLNELTSYAKYSAIKGAHN